MARVLFIFKNMIFFFKTEKVLSVLILLGMVVCDTVFLVFGNVFWSDVKSGEYEIYKNNVVTLEIQASDAEGFLEAAGSREEITSVFFRCEEVCGENPPVTLSAYSPSFDPDGQRIRLGRGLTGACGECVVSDRFLQRRDAAAPGSVIGGELRFLDADWSCVGVIAPGAADDFDILVGMADLTAHLKDRELPVTAGFRYRQGTSLIELRSFVDFLTEEFCAKNVSVPSRTAGGGFGNFLSDMSEMLVLLVIAVINDMFIYRFLLEKRMYVYGVFKLQGMDNRLAFVGLFSETLIYLAAAFGVSLSLYLCGTALAGQTDAVLRHGREIWFSFVIVGVINLFFFGLAAVRLVRRPPVELIRESVVGGS